MRTDNIRSINERRGPTKFFCQINDDSQTSPLKPSQELRNRNWENSYQNSPTEPGCKSTLTGFEKHCFQEGTHHQTSKNNPLPLPLSGGSRSSSTYGFSLCGHVASSSSVSTLSLSHICKKPCHCIQGPHRLLKINSSSQNLNHIFFI